MIFFPSVFCLLGYKTKEAKKNFLFTFVLSERFPLLKKIL